MLSGLAEHVAYFLKSSRGLSKRIVGKYLGEVDVFNQKVCAELRLAIIIVNFCSSVHRLASPGLALVHFSRQFQGGAGTNLATLSPRELTCCNVLSSTRRCDISWANSDYLARLRKSTASCRRFLRSEEPEACPVSVAADWVRFLLSRRYCKDNPRTFQSPDTAYVLAFATIMLNTDLHNPNIKRSAPV
jgi:hypothetical protein